MSRKHYVIINARLPHEQFIEEDEKISMVDERYLKNAIDYNKKYKIGANRSKRLARD